MQPAWVATITGILVRPRPAITALGGARSLGSTGMELDWPYLDPALDLDTVVAKQAAEKTEIASVKVKILTGSRADHHLRGRLGRELPTDPPEPPRYREAYLRILGDRLRAGHRGRCSRRPRRGRGGSVVILRRPRTRTRSARSCSRRRHGRGHDRDPRDRRSGQLGRVRAARRAPGPGALRSTAPRTSRAPPASVLAINVSGLPIVRAPFLTGNTHLVTNGEAAGWHEDGPFPISAEDVAKLGQNVAIWGMGATAASFPAGIISDRS